jgi:hypothetical protein
MLDHGLAGKKATVAALYSVVGTERPAGNGDALCRRRRRMSERPTRSNSIYSAKCATDSLRALNMAFGRSIHPRVDNPA